MDPRLLRYYNSELQHLREMGAEFARQFPKIAGRLGMSGIEVADPYIERLLEGVGFLAARVQLKLDAEFPRFTQSLLEVVLPHYLAPVPSMVVARFDPTPDAPNLAKGVNVPRGTGLIGQTGAADATACEFRTAHDVTLYPLTVEAASYRSFFPDIPLGTLPLARRVKGGLRLSLRTAAGAQLSELAIDRLPLYLGGSDEVANRLYELLMSSALGVLVVPSAGATRAPVAVLPPEAVQPLGFDDAEALLPVTLRSFGGYRLLMEYFALPQRFRFVDLRGIGDGLRALGGEAADVVILLGRSVAGLESVVDVSNVTPYCTPAINLFPKRADRIRLSEGEFEYHVVPDRTRPLDFEVYDVTSVVGYGSGSQGEQEFQPFYAAYSDLDGRSASAYFSTRREPRLPSQAQIQRGPRSSYIGTEVYLGLVDASDAPFDGDLRQLSVQTRCTNRDLPLQMPVGLGATDFTLDAIAPVARTRVVSGPSRPYAPPAGDAVAWRAVSHLSLNYLSLVDAGEEEGAAALRDLLELYAPAAEAAARRQVEGIRTVQARPVVRRLPGPGPLAFGRGVQITVTLDDLAFEGGSPFLMGAVLDRYFARHVSINAFVETVLRSASRGDIHRWAPQPGTRPTC